MRSTGWYTILFCLLVTMALAAPGDIVKTISETRFLSYSSRTETKINNAGAGSATYKAYTSSMNTRLATKTDVTRFTNFSSHTAAGMLTKQTIGAQGVFSSISTSTTSNRYLSVANSTAYSGSRNAGIIFHNVTTLNYIETDGVVKRFGSGTGTGTVNANADVSSIVVSCSNTDTGTPTPPSYSTSASKASGKFNWR